MTALFAGLTTLDVLHRLDHVPDPLLKVTSTDFTMAAGGPATNAAVTYAALNTASRVLSDSDDEAGAGVFQSRPLSWVPSGTAGAPGLRGSRAVSGRATVRDEVR